DFGAGVAAREGRAAAVKTVASRRRNRVGRIGVRFMSRAIIHLPGRFRQNARRQEHAGRRSSQRAVSGCLTSVISETVGAVFRGSEASRYSRRATIARAPEGTGTVKRSRRDSRGPILESFPTDAAFRNWSATLSR